MAGDKPGRDWPDIEVNDRETTAIRERTRTTIAITVIVVTFLTFIGAIIFRFLHGDWGWPMGLVLGFLMGWVTRIIGHYFGVGSTGERVDFF
jgi:fatty acid desaturase